MLRLLILLGVLGTTRLATADDTAFGGSAAELAPLERTDVQLHAERIVLMAHPTEMRWDVSARYEFVNPGATAVKLQVGFPEARCFDGQPFCSTAAFQRLTTRVDGQPVQHRKGQLGGGYEWGTIWLFDVMFPPGKTVVVEHEYAAAGGRDSMGYRYLPYITRTGRNWAKTIEKAQFVVRVPPFTRVVLVPRGQGIKGQPPRVAADGLVELVAEAAHWVPPRDVAFGFNASSVGTGAEDCRSTVESEDAQRCINAFYAAKGYPFTSAKLKETYYAGNPNFVLDRISRRWWRQTPPQPGFTTAWFEDWERERLRQLEQQAKQYREAQGENATVREPLPSPVAAAASLVSVAPPPSDIPSAWPGAPPSGRPQRKPLPASAKASATPSPATPAPVRRTTLCQAVPGQPCASRTPRALLALLFAVAALRWHRQSDRPVPTPRRATGRAKRSVRGRDPLAHSTLLDARTWTTQSS